MDREEVKVSYLGTCATCFGEVHLLEGEDWMRRLCYGPCSARGPQARLTSEVGLGNDDVTVVKAPPAPLVARTKRQEGARS